MTCLSWPAPFQGFKFYRVANKKKKKKKTLWQHHCLLAFPTITNSMLVGSYVFGQLYILDSEPYTLMIGSINKILFRLPKLFFTPSKKSYILLIDNTQTNHKGSTHLEGRSKISKFPPIIHIPKHLKNPIKMATNSSTSMT